MPPRSTPKAANRIDAERAAQKGTEPNEQNNEKTMKKRVRGLSPLEKSDRKLDKSGGLGMVCEVRF